MDLNILSVDFQNEFCTEGGLAYQPRDCHSFRGCLSNLFPFHLMENAWMDLSRSTGFCGVAGPTS